MFFHIVKEDGNAVCSLVVHVVYSTFDAPFTLYMYNTL